MLYLISFEHEALLWFKFSVAVRCICVYSWVGVCYIYIFFSIFFLVFFPLIYCQQFLYIIAFEEKKKKFIAVRIFRHSIYLVSISVYILNGNTKIHGKKWKTQQLTHSVLPTHLVAKQNGILYSGYSRIIQKTATKKKE